jgi:predicted ester cyclase
VSVGNTTASLVRAFIDEALNRHDLSAFDRLCAQEYVWHGMAGAEVRGLETFKREVVVFFDAFPDITIDVLDIVVDGDRAAVRFRESGTHQGVFGDAAPTGRSLSWDGIAIYRVKDELIVEEWSVLDMLALLEGVGASPLEGH